MRESEFAEFYAGHKDRCLRAAIASGMDAAQAEDAVAEAFSRAWARWRTVRAIEAPSAWVVRTAINHNISMWRRTHREMASAVLPEGTAAGDSFQRLDLIAAVRALPPRQREVVVLRYLLDLDTSTVARTLRIAPGTVSAHLHRALSTLRDHYTAREGITR